MLLAGDIGGTHIRLGLFTVEAKRLRPLAEATFGSHEYPTLEAAIEAFLASQRAVAERACLGLAGPVRKGRVEGVNLPWIVDQRQLESALGIGTVDLVNDLEANAYGLAALCPDDLVVLNRGEPGAEGNRALIAAGTGLGQAGLFWDGADYRPFSSEGGHSDFAPGDELGVELLRYLRREITHVSWERIVSGPGLVNIYRFLRDTGRGEEPAWLAEAMRRQDPADVVSRTALEATVPLCVQALELFISFYGAEAGNLALTFMATGGVYVGGGIAPKILPRLREPTFMTAFTAKGRLQPLLEAIPVRVILNDKTALLGAARCAALRAGLL